VASNDRNFKFTALVSLPVPGVVQIVRRRGLTDWSAWRAAAS
jgi:hypothetical protein